MFKKRKQQYVNSYYKPLTSMKIDNIIKQAIPDKPANSGISDSEGLSRAYNAPNSIYVDGNKMYIAGTHNLGDVVDDLKIPLHDVQNTMRYKEATTVLNNSPDVDTIISHSLGSSVAAEINKQNNNQFKTRMYGSPFIDFSFNPSRNPNNIRFRHPGDIFSMFDTGAVAEEGNTTYSLINPHSFTGFTDDEIKNNPTDGIKTNPGVFPDG